MDFSWALNQLKDGEYVKRGRWNNQKYYYMLKDGHIIDTLETKIVINNAELFAEDWMLFQPILENGSLVQIDDEITGIILDFDDYGKVYTILTENKCVNHYHESDVSSVKDFGLSKVALKTYYNDIIETLQSVSKELENK